MSDIKKRFDRRDFMKFATGTAMTLPLLAACAETATEAPVEDDGGNGETGLVEGQRGGLWLPTEQPEMKEISASLDNPNFYTVVHWHLIDDYGYAAEEGFDKYEFFVSDEPFQAVIGKEITFGQVDADYVMVAKEEGVPVVSVATHRDHEWHIQGLSPAIKKPSDLIGGQAAGLGSVGTRTFAQRRDAILKWSDGEVDIETDVEHIRVSGGSDARQAALLADQVQVASIYTRHLKGMADGGASFFVSGWYEYPQEAIIVHQDTYDSSPRTIVNFLRAYLKSLNTIRDWDMKPQIEQTMADVRDMTLTPEFEAAWVSQMEQLAPGGMWRTIAMRFFLDQLQKYGVIAQGTQYSDFAKPNLLRIAQKELFGFAWPPDEQLDIFTVFNMDPNLQ
jgi:ABC-type nitrate/sulfonate/bicarbonate transport system substrate-binding protein